jgi:thiamine transport system permease protein
MTDRTGGVGRWLLRLAVAAVPVAFLAVLFVWPLVEVLQRSLTGVGPTDALGVLGRPAVRSVAAFTVGQALASVALTLVVGLPIAHVLGRYRFRGRRAVRALVLVPFVLPTLVVASAFDALFVAAGTSVRAGPGWSLAAILGAHVFFNVAVVVRLVGGYWATLDPRLEEAAGVLGAGAWRAFWFVTVPRLAPVLAAASTVVFLFTVTSFGIILVLGGPGRATIETEIYRYAVFRAEFDVAAVLALAQLVVVSVLAVLTARLQRRYTTGELRRAPERLVAADTARRRLHLGAVLALAAVVVGAPLAALVERSLRVGDRYGFAHYRALTEPVALLPVTAFEAVLTSVRVALVAGVVATVVGVLASLTVVRGGRTGRVLEAMTLVPLGVSAVTLGFGYLLAFRYGDLRRSPWLVPAAHAVIALPFVLAAVVPALRSIDRRLREVAATLGASPWAVWREVDRPVLQRAAVIGAGFSVAISMGEFGATSFLGRGREGFTAPLAIFRLLSQPGAAIRGQALALSVVIGLIVAVLAAVLEQRRGKTVSTL